MDNQEFAKTLEYRTRQYGISIIKLSSVLPNAIETQVIKKRLTKSGTNIGLNYREANRTLSKIDFKNRIKIAENELSETEYWLEIINDFNWIEKDILSLIMKETKELLTLFTTILSKL